MQNVPKMDPRPNISEALANTLRGMIFDGVLGAGERINEVHLADQLGVSRTPLREALSMLAAEEALESIPRRGFFVRELTRKEFEDIYPMRSLLDPEALRLSGIPSQEGMERLASIQNRKLSSTDLRHRMSLDDAWHLELVSNCENQVLIDLIRLFMRRFRRYGLAFCREPRIAETANREHVEIILALRAGKMDEACEWLVRNLTSDKEPILEWLDEREE